MLAPVLVHLQQRPALTESHYGQGGLQQEHSGERMFRLYPEPPPFSLSPCCTCCRFSLHTFVHTRTRSHNGCSKFFQGISRLINRLVVWGSSEVQRSRLNPLTGRIISGRWVHTSPVAPHGPPAPCSLPPPPVRVRPRLNAPERRRRKRPECQRRAGGQAAVAVVLDECHLSPPGLPAPIFTKLTSGIQFD